ncbi:type VI secretion system-associated FHA domain protein TagH [Marinobacter sp. Arc7-DN-1]|uniref:type VI secretion system-associated FHA domain protein TagH n=1 Tax=Marinobacter sp. Arc7-DN-1 TaxID=2304594 RepID=UPI000E44B402|nr:type VI secretion system-associated FHA domain protein TagH [Marinobacter sp. Arc7-DN-1]AXS83937.1 type VI secretion system-associated FHA domain protein TagH [Marinobacter sp. Arc7-DN-1]
MEEQQAAGLKLTITNPTVAGGGATIEHCFSVRGGSIGTAASDTWRLSPQRTGAVPGHAEIRFLDGGFCLIDRSGRTYINSASQPVGRGRRARLKHGDRISVGRYRLRAELAEAVSETFIESGETEQTTHLVDVGEGQLVRGPDPMGLNENPEPLQKLASVAVAAMSEDPLAPWNGQPGEEEPDTDALMAGEASWYAAERNVSDEYRENRDVAVGLPVRKGERDRMSEITKTGDRRDASDQSSKHISGAPLLRGMEAGLDFADSDEMRLFLEEAGQTLKATMEGLLALHQGEDSRHQALRTRLQPIEDNPLRLGEDYEDTVQTLFASHRSPVHLSAPAAVRESLQSLNHHQQATREAISEALEAILHAFSPEALLRRFHGYRRGLRENEDEGHWAWDMYQHYYRELKSSRQQGFERLFREVFEQAYDQHLRQLQRENPL